MVIEFRDENGKSAHNDFQGWRRSNEGGFFINVKSKNDLVLHRAPCDHHGDSEWETEKAESWGSLTKKMKACDDDLLKLREWAEEKYRGVKLRACKDCKPI